MIQPVDLRSDTVTRPSADMVQAMASAAVGDDVLDGDPTTIALEEHTAELLGKEAALFVPSGTMANQLAIRLHCDRDDRFVCESKCHLFNYEQGGYAQLSGVPCLTLEGHNGILSADDFKTSLQPEDDHYSRTSMWAIENTHNMAGGIIQPPEAIAAIAAEARLHGISMHLDGARFFNAVVASEVKPAEMAAHFDTISVCFSKGLGAPVGSALVGSTKLIRQARRARKLLGGGMRQSGVLTAGALHALKNNVQRLREDHMAAKQLAEAISSTDGFSLLIQPQTNIVICEVDEKLGSAQQVCDQLSSQGVLALAISQNRIRFVTHLDASSRIDLACNAVHSIGH